MFFMTSPERPTSLVSGSKEWFAAVNPNATGAKKQMADLLFLGAEAVFPESMEEISKVLSKPFVVDNFATKVIAIMRKAGWSQDMVSFKAFSARVIIDGMKDRNRFAIRRGITHKSQSEKTEENQEEVVDIIKTLEETVQSFEERLPDDERDKPTLLSFAFRLSIIKEREGLMKQVEKGNWKPLRERMKAQQSF